MINLTVVATVFAVIFIAELPDKSLFASLVLGTRYKALWVWVGVSLAFIVHVIIAVAAGGFLTLLPRTAVEIVVAILFVLGAFLLLRPEAVEHPGHEDAAEAAALKARAGTETGTGAWKVIATSFAVVFVGEWGDITQIATANLAAKYNDPLRRTRCGARPHGRSRYGDQDGEHDPSEGQHRPRPADRGNHSGLIRHRGRRPTPPMTATA